MYAQQCCTVQNKDIARVGMQYDEVLHKCVGNTQTRGYNVNSFSLHVPFLCMLLHTQSWKWPISITHSVTLCSVSPIHFSQNLSSTMWS